MPQCRRCAAHFLHLFEYDDEQSLNDGRSVCIIGSMIPQETNRCDSACQIISSSALYRTQAGVFVLRAGVSLLMLTHGWGKLVMLMEGKGSEWMDPLGVGATASLALCVFAEFFCSMAILIGFLTRAASFVLVVNFFVAVFVYGNQSVWPQNELPLLYMICFVVLIGTGSGPLGVDRALARRLRCDHSHASR